MTSSSRALSHFDPHRAQELVQLYERSPIGHTLGMRLSYDSEARALVELDYQAPYENAGGGIHGGVIGIMVDTAGWFAAAVRYASWISTADYHVNLLEPVQKENLRAVGQLVRAGNRLAVSQVEVRSDSGRLIAVGTGTFAVTSRPFSLPK